MTMKPTNGNRRINKHRSTMNTHTQPRANVVEIFMLNQTQTVHLTERNERENEDVVISFIR